MQAYTAEYSSWPLFRAPLSWRAQVAAGIAAVAVLAGSFIFTQSLLFWGALLALGIIFLVVRNPIASLFAVIVVNVTLSIHGKDATGNNAASGFDIAMGLVIVAVIVYWIVRLRIFERSTLSFSAGQVAFLAFSVWSVIVTAIGSSDPHWTLNNAIREMLDLSPLIVLPVLYARFIKVGSKEERWILFSVVVSAVVMVIWNVFRMRSNMIRAYYLYQIGRSTSDEMLSGLLVLIATSLMMKVQGFWRVSGSIVLFLLGIIGVAVSFARTLYIAVILSIFIILFLGNWEERWRGIRNLCLTGLMGVGALIPLYFSSRIIRLLLLRYAFRFMTSQHVGTDLSMVERFIEWKTEIPTILHSPILGLGFGSQFRVFNLAWGTHSWTGFSHSSYLYMILKTGLIGALLFFGAYMSFLLKGLKLLQSSFQTQTARLMLRIGIGCLVCMLIDCYSDPILDSKTDLIWVGLVWGYFLVNENKLKEFQVIRGH